MREEISDGQMMNLGAQVRRFQSDAEFWKQECERLKADFKKFRDKIEFGDAHGIDATNGVIQADIDLAEHSKRIEARK